MERYPRNMKAQSNNAHVNNSNQHQNDFHESGNEFPPMGTLTSHKNAKNSRMPSLDRSGGVNNNDGGLPSLSNRGTVKNIFG